MTLKEAEPHTFGDMGDRIAPWLALAGAGGIVLYAYAFTYTSAFYFSLGVKPADVGVVKADLLGWSGQLVIFGVAVYVVGAYVIGGIEMLWCSLKRNQLGHWRGYGLAKGDTKVDPARSIPCPFRLPAPERVIQAAALLLGLWAIIYHSLESGILAGTLFATASCMDKHSGGKRSYQLAWWSQRTLQAAAIVWGLLAVASSSWLELIFALILLATASIMVHLSGRKLVRLIGISLPVLVIALYLTSVDAGLSAAAVKADRPLNSWMAANLGLEVEKVTVTQAAGTVPGVDTAHKLLLLGGANGVYVLWDATAHKVLRVPQGEIVLTGHGWL